MTDTKANKQIVISANDARGARSPKDVGRMDTLLPMLIWTIGLTVLGVGAIAVFMAI